MAGFVRGRGLGLLRTVERLSELRLRINQRLVPP
jgi:hypothetical protein